MKLKELAKSIMGLLGILAFTTLIVVASSHKALADDDGDEHESHDYYVNEHESHNDGDNDWDFSDDFDQQYYVIEEQPLDQVNSTIQNNTSLQNNTNYTINMALFNDDDGDGVINRDDQYPGKNDALYVDSDGDGVVNFYDQYPGLNDSDFNATNTNQTQQYQNQEQNENMFIKFLKFIGLA